MILYHVDFSTYSLEELQEARRTVDRKAFPERAAAIEAEIRKRQIPNLSVTTSNETVYKPSTETLTPGRVILSLPFLLFGLGNLIMLSLTWASVFSSEQSMGCGIIAFLIFTGIGFGIGLEIWGKEKQTLLMAVGLLIVAAVCGVTVLYGILVAALQLSGHLPDDQLRHIDGLKYVMWSGAPSFAISLIAAIHLLKETVHIPFIHGPRK